MQHTLDLNYLFFTCVLLLIVKQDFYETPVPNRKQTSFCLC